MNHLRTLCCAVLWTAALLPAAVRADDFAEAGRRVFERHCQTCHGGTGAADSQLGPNLAGILGRRAGAGDSGVHSRAVLDSDTVWTRESLRRFLSEPGREMPGTLMPTQVRDPKDLENVLDFLQTLH